jgi:hypothetical protein
VALKRDSVLSGAPQCLQMAASCSFLFLQIGQIFSDEFNGYSPDKTRMNSRHICESYTELPNITTNGQDNCILNIQL